MSIYLRVCKPFASLSLLLLVLTSLLAAQPTAQAQEKPTSAWRNTNLTMPPKAAAYCFDATQPNVLLVAVRSAGDAPTGTYSYNWVTGQNGLLSTRAFSSCSEDNGLMFEVARGTEGAIRFSSREPAGQPIPYAPAEIAADGTLQLYSLTDKKLYASSDGGNNWQERGQQFAGRFVDIGAAQADARVLYAVLRDRPAKGEYLYSIYFSTDAGVNWQARAQYRLPETSNFAISAGLGRAAPVGTLLLYINSKGIGAYESVTYLSGDSGQTFTEVDRTRQTSGTIAKNEKFFYSPEGLVRFSNRYSRQLALELSPDNGKSWQPLARPALPTTSSLDKLTEILQARSGPANLLLGHADGSGELWHTADGARSWQKLDSNMSRLLVSPYAPHTLLGIKSRKLYVLDVPNADKTLTAGAISTQAPGSFYFPETRHNLTGAFKRYWEQNGGLARFGFPKTEAFREFNPADGKVYLVQYFERNRFEYHPENVGTTYEMLLGLLGNQVAEPRRLAGEKPFSRAENGNFPGAAYFAETGHNLRGSFKAYWEASGGLTAYGFPISEELEEVNPDDGKKYLVQYFERNRFEYHPENAGTQYEVLLGLLGNTLLKQKGWLS